MASILRRAIAVARACIDTAREPATPLVPVGSVDFGDPRGIARERDAETFSAKLWGWFDEHR